ncbi:RUS family member 1-like isoform X2 [Apostichopus japonicus]
MDLLVFRETYGTRSSPTTYYSSYDGKLKRNANSSFSFSGIILFFKTVFLPQGYPESVSSDYLTYQIWDTVQAFSSSITGTLATHAMLKGVGVGDETASAAAATITWLLKDGTGMVGRIVFAWYRGTSLDSEAKTWRLFADVLNDLATCVELVSPLFPGYFTLIACISGLMKSIVGVAGGATRAALTMHQARRNNMADVSAKDGSQETLVNLSALIVGLIITPTISGNASLTWLLFFIFTSLHIYANYCAVSCVVMEMFNQERFHVVVQEYLNSLQRRILIPTEANAQEPIVIGFRQERVKLGVPFYKSFKSLDDLKQASKSSKNPLYLLRCIPRQRLINIILHHNSSTRDHLQAAFQAEIICHSFNQIQKFGKLGKYDMDVNDTINQTLQRKLAAAVSEPSSFHEWEIERTSAELCDRLFPQFLTEVKERGWRTDHCLLGIDEWRAEWDLQGIAEKKGY